MATAIALVLLLWKKQQRLFSNLLLVLKRLGVRTDGVEGRMAKATQIDASIGTFYRAHKKRFFLVLFFHSMGWMLGALRNLCDTQFTRTKYHLPRCTFYHIAYGHYQQPVLLHAL